MVFGDFYVPENLKTYKKRCRGGIPFWPEAHRTRSYRGSMVDQIFVQEWVDFEVEMRHFLVEVDLNDPWLVNVSYGKHSPLSIFFCTNVSSNVLGRFFEVN